ncbi:ABC transporter permease [Actinocorallia longicatena]|uniref:Transport permease protein n=2 Tax=Actinocorallia longicatena TaxID=111803 RepID=A0ABP6Q819_9ACTN
MSHPERPSGGLAGGLAAPPASAGASSESLAAFAARNGLTQSAARPNLRQYVSDVWNRRHFIWMFASSKSMSMYTSSKLGQLWQVLTPLLNALVYFLIFGVLLGTKKNIPDYVPWLVTGVFLFSFTQRSVTAGAKSIGTNLSLIRALHFPRATLPLAYTVVELQQLLVAMGVLIVIVLGYGVLPTLSWLLIIPIVLLQLLFNVGLSMIVARIGAFTRDITQLIPFVLRTWLYTSGVIFSLASVTEKTAVVQENPWIKNLMEANPGYVYVELARQALIPKYVSQTDPQVSMDQPGLLWIYAVVWAVVMLVGGFYWFYRAEERYGRG